MLRFLIYGMGILEFALYSTHEIIHHSFAVKQTFWSIVSYIFATLTLVLCIIETFLIFDFAKKVFYAKEIDEFEGIGEKNIGIHDIMQFYIQHVKK